MKKFFLSLTVLFVVFVKAQNTTPFWSLAGNSNVEATSKLGTTNNRSLRFYTNNVQRMIINSAQGYVGVGTTSPVNILTVQSSGGTPSASWLDGLRLPVFAGFGEDVSSEFLLAGASNSATSRAVFQGRRSRGTLAAPKVVITDDYITSLLASAYDGKTFQNPALVSFFVDGTPSSGNVPVRISFVTGSNAGNRVERLKIGSTGNIDFNNGQVYLNQTNGYLGVGTTAPVYKLHVENTGGAIYGRSTSGGYAIYGSSTYLGVYGAGDSYGVYGSGNYGIYGSGTYGAYGSGTYGTYGYGSSYGAYGNSSNVGVYGSGTNYGVSGGGGSYGVSGSGTYIGVFGTTTNGEAAVVGNNTNKTGGNFFSNNGYGLIAGTGRSDKNWAGVFNGNVYAYGAYQPSDKNFKKNIKTLENAMSIINQLKPKSYEYLKEGKFAVMNLPSGSQYGLIAQELEEVLPGLVKEIEYAGPVVATMPDTSLVAGKTFSVAQPAANEKITSKAINYTELIPIMIKAMQEQEAKIEALTELVKKLSLNNTSGSVKLNGYLSQSIPNPASKTARITYEIPEDFTKAELVIANMAGQKLKQLRLNKSGMIDIDTSKLSAGTYSYTLVVDGATLNTKKMVVVR